MSTIENLDFTQMGVLNRTQLEEIYIFQKYHKMAQSIGYTPYNMHAYTQYLPVLKDSLMVNNIDFEDFLSYSFNSWHRVPNQINIHFNINSLLENIKFLTKGYKIEQDLILHTARIEFKAKLKTERERLNKAKIQTLLRDM